MTNSQPQKYTEDFDGIVDVNGLRKNIHLTGNGSPLVILESGAGWPGMSWHLVQQEVEKFTRVLSYDRAGQGLSEPSKAPRTSKNIATELHDLLQIIKIPGPYILVGHSLGGINIRTFTALYPNEVAGLILVDSSHEDQIERNKKNPPPFSWIDRVEHFFGKKSSLIAYALHRYEAKKGKYSHVLNLFSKEEQQKIESILSGYQHFLEAYKTGELIEKSFAELKNMNRNIREPVTIITAGKSNPVSPENAAMSAYFVAFEKIWRDLQKNLTTFSTQSMQVFAEKSAHMIPFEEPEIIVSEIKKMVLKIRENAIL